MRRAAAVFFAFLAGLIPAAAAAHPHVLIDAHMVFVFEHGKVTALQMGWKFDPVYSGTLAQDFDADKDGALSPAEIADIEQNAFSDTAPLSYFTHARIDGAAIAWPKPTGFKVFTHDKALVYAFRLDFPKPVDPRTSRLKVSVYEESFYVDVAFPNNAAVAATGEGSAGCKMDIADDKATPLLGGAAYPQMVDVICGAP